MLIKDNPVIKAKKILKMFNEHRAQPGSFGYGVAKEYAVRGVNLLISELPEEEVEKRIWYRVVIQEIQNL